jgi:predicted LPLAT superfamily acyltransferase
MTAPQPVAARPEWMARAERGSATALALMSWFSLRFGRRLSRLVLPFITLYFALTASAARRASAQYLTRCLGRPAGFADVLRNIYAFAATVHDRVYLLNDRHELFDLRGEGLDLLDAHGTQRGGVFLFGAHLGSFEALRSVAREHPLLQVYMAMYPDNARRVNRALAAINPRATQHIIELGRVDAMLVMHERLQEGATVGVLADRASGADEFHRVEFLGAPAAFPSGPFRMAALLRRPVYFMTALYRGGNRYELHIELLADLSQPPAGREAAARDLLGRYVATLERHCRSAPYNWFNFYDFWDGAHAPAN